MPDLDPAVWYNVCGKDIQIWNGHSDNHQKMGTLTGPLGILAIEEYKGSFRFVDILILEQNVPPAEDNRNPATEAYKDYWIREEDVSGDPCEPPVEPPVVPPVEPPVEPPVDPTPPGVATDAELGNAVRVVVNEGGSVSFP